MIQTTGADGDGTQDGDKPSPPPTPTSKVVTPDPARLLNLGPQYIRNRYLKREPGIERKNRRSAVELLEESKSLYVKSESVRENKQVLKLTESRLHRRSLYIPSGQSESDSGAQHGGTGSSTDTTPASPSSSNISTCVQGSRTPTNTILDELQTWPTGHQSLSVSQTTIDSGGKDAEQQRQQQQQTPTETQSGQESEDCVVTDASSVKPKESPSEPPSGSSASGAGASSPSIKENQEDQVDFAKRGRFLSDPLPCTHGLFTNRPCKECVNTNTTQNNINNSSTVTDNSHLGPHLPPPVPPKPAEHLCQQQQQQQQLQKQQHENQGLGAGAVTGVVAGGPGSRQPPPVPPKRHSSISLPDSYNTGSIGSNNALVASLTGSLSGANKPPPPVPPKPAAADRNSIHQPEVAAVKWGPPPVPPKPSVTSGSGPPTPPPSSGGSFQHPPQPPLRGRSSTYNGMEGDPLVVSNASAGSPHVGVRPKSGVVDSPRSSGGGSTPPPPPPPVPPKPKPTLMSSEAWREAHTDTSSEIDQHSSSSMVKVEDKLVPVRRRPRKFHRSRSDLTKRFSNSSDLSELSARLSRNSADLEKFFNEMGLDRSVLEPMMMSACQKSASDLHLFESASSLESPDVRSWCSEDDAEHPLKHEAVEERTPPGGPTSIVERNARIIKWLCSVKKAASHEEPLTEQ